MWFYFLTGKKEDPKQPSIFSAMSKAKSKPATASHNKQNGVNTAPSDDVMVLSDNSDDVIPVGNNQAKAKPSKAKPKG